MPHLLIIGGNGELGKAASLFFKSKGFTVTVLVRDETKAAALKTQGVLIRKGDLTKPATITGIFEGVDIVLTAAHAMLGRGSNKSKQVDEEGHLLLIAEAKKSGVKQFIFTSVNNPAPDHPIDFFRTKYVIEQTLIQSGLDYTILRLPAFMEWHVYNLLGKNIVKKGKADIIGKGNNPVNFIAIKDVVAALNIIIGDPNFYNKTIQLAGPQNISRNEIAALFGKALQIKPKINYLPVPMAKVLSVLFKPFHPGISRIMKLSVYSEKTNETLDKKLSIEQFGLEPTHVEAYIQSVIHK